MNTCSTCRFFGTEDGQEFDWWDDDDEPKSETTKHHKCARIIHGNGSFYGRNGYKKLANEGAYVTDGSGYAARLHVLPTFGCMMHEDK